MGAEVLGDMYGCVGTVCYYYTMTITDAGLLCHASV